VGGWVRGCVWLGGVGRLGNVVKTERINNPLSLYPEGQWYTLKRELTRFMRFVPEIV